MAVRTRRSSWVLLCMMGWLGCGGNESPASKPNVTAGPVETMTLSFLNPLTEDLYVPWQDTQPAFELAHGQTELVVHRTCIPFCGNGCVCAPCTKSNRVRKLLPGESLQISWIPIHFVMNSCNDSVSCQCAESWPITAGQYTLSLRGFTDAQGGQPISEHPNILVGASPSSTSQNCQATKVFTLAAKETAVQAQFLCQ
ncbi:MAG TPA: hypothetical protein PK140_06070 [Polyangiaceae bacterium]|nr:hypothetical protein [Polyangiaceae bacterium]HQM08939.1 hypothetical protein [Polyangiaceae bacterium]